MARRDEAYSITSAPASPQAERQYRVRRYLWTMGVRTALFLAGIIVQGWIGLLLMGLAGILPYISVVLANQITRPRVNIALPPMVLKDTAELPVGHPDRTEAAY